MSALTGRTPGQTYGDLLNVENAGSGINGTGQLVIQDGLGNPTAISVGSANNGAAVSGPFNVTGKITATGGIAGLQAAIGFTLDGGGVPIQPGLEMDIEVPFACSIDHVTLLANIQGSVTIDLWRVPLASYPPTSANSICGSQLPIISGALYSQNAALVGWTTQLNKGDIVRAYVNSASTLTRVTVSLLVTKI